MKIIISILVIFAANFNSLGCEDFEYKRKLEDQEDFIQRLSPATFRIIFDHNNEKKSIGTATAITNDGLFITAAHIFTLDNNRIVNYLNNKKGKLYLENETLKEHDKILEVTSVRPLLDRNADIAILKTMTDPSIKINHINIELKRRPEDSLIWVAGFRVDSDRLTFDNGNVSQLTKDGTVRAHKLGVHHGFSGAMAINDYGYGFGILSGKFILSPAKDKDEINYGEFDDNENGSLNFSYIPHYYQKIADEDILNKSNFIVNGFVDVKKLKIAFKNNRFYAIQGLMNIVLSNQRIKFITSDEARQFANITYCILPVNEQTDIFGRILINGSSTQSTVIANEVLTTNAILAREKKLSFDRSKDYSTLRDAEEYFSIAFEASKHSNISQNTKNYIANEYYLVSKQIEESDFPRMEPIKKSNDILGEQLKTIYKVNFEEATHYDTNSLLVQNAAQSLSNSSDHTASLALVAALIRHDVARKNLSYDLAFLTKMHMSKSKISADSRREFSKSLHAIENKKNIKLEAIKIDNLLGPNSFEQAINKLSH